MLRTARCGLAEAPRYFSFLRAGGAANRSEGSGCLAPGDLTCDGTSAASAAVWPLAGLCLVLYLLAVLGAPPSLSSGVRGSSSAPRRFMTAYTPTFFLRPDVSFLSSLHLPFFFFVVLPSISCRLAFAFAATFCPWIK